ncbi:MAG TPA: 5-formyltetrahydrofolate cyclo-ligase [Bacillales bacterium]|nr:5-formyltetrahydrofolate cyclo-ligase [Bacillales bacterium]
MDAKRMLREKMKKTLNAIPADERKRWQEEAAQRLYALPEWKESRTIGITLSTPDEIDTEAIIQKAWEQEKNVAVPKVLPAEKAMQFRQISSFADVRPMFAGIREPLERRSRLIVPEAIDLLVVPGLVFSEAGYRIGFGGGFYDRFLERHQLFAVSLAFECQLNADVPVEPFDRPVDMIVTESRVLTCNG